MSGSTGTQELLLLQAKYETVLKAIQDEDDWLETHESEINRIKSIEEELDEIEAEVFGPRVFGPRLLAPLDDWPALLLYPYGKDKTVAQQIDICTKNMEALKVQLASKVAEREIMERQLETAAVTARWHDTLG